MDWDTSMAMLGIEFVGFLGLAVLSIEVAVYAIVTSFISWVVRYTEEEFVEETSRLEAEIEGISSRISETGVHKADIDELKKTLGELEGKKAARDNVRKNISISKSLFIPGSLALFSILVIVATTFIFTEYYIGGVIIALVILAISICTEVPILLTIHRIAQWKEEGGFDDLNKIVEEVGRINMSLAEDAMRTQVETSGRLIDKIDELIGVVSEKLGLKPSDLDIEVFDSSNNKVRVLDLEVGETYTYVLSITNRSPYPVQNLIIEFAASEAFTLGFEEIGDCSRRPDFAVPYPRGPMLKQTADMFNTNGVITLSFMIRADQSSDSELYVWVVSSTHEREEIKIPIEC